MNYSSGTILLIDDNPLVLANLSEYLEASGYLCAKASTVQQALALVQTRKFGLVVCDHDLPDGKGTQVVERIASLELNIPVIFITATIPQLIDKVRQMPNVRKIFIKPMKQTALLESVKKFLHESEDKLFPRLIGPQERHLILNLLSA